MSPHDDKVVCLSVPDIISLTCLSILFLIGVCMNVTILVASIKERLYLSRNSLLIINLSTSDLLIAAGILVYPVTNVILTRNNICPTPCPQFEFLQDIAPIVSLLTLTAMSHDRFRSLNCPRLHGQRNRKASAFHLKRFVKSGSGITIIATWILACTSIIPLFFMDRFMDLLLFVIIRCFFTYIIPLLVITFNYSYVVYKMMSLSRSLSSHSQSPALRRNHEKAKQRAVLISLLVLMFIVCSMPRHAYLWILYFYADHVKVNDRFYQDWNTAGYYLYYTYPVLNSLSLYITSQQYRSLCDKYLFRCRIGDGRNVVRDDEDEMEITYNSKITTSHNTDSTFLSTARALNMDI